MTKNNYSQETTDRYARTLRKLINKGATLENLNSVKEVLAKMTEWHNSTKALALNVLIAYYHFYQIPINPKTLPKYEQEQKIPFIPTENELDQLIANSRSQMATFLQTLKETGARYGEAYRLKWEDYDSERLTLSINDPEKHSNPRQLKISTRLAVMLTQLPHTQTKIFTYTRKSQIRKCYEKIRKRTAKTLGNERISRIKLHTFRHWKAVTVLHQTNNIFAVMKMLGHKHLNNTQRYCQMLPDLTDDYTCEFASTPEQIKKLIETGYEKIDEIDNQHIYRKRK
jgi:integrase